MLLDKIWRWDGCCLRPSWSHPGRTVRAFSQTADLSGACPDKRFSRARVEDFGSRRGPTDEHRSFIRQPSREAGSDNSGAEKYEKSIAWPSVPGRLNTLPQNKTTTKRRSPSLFLDLSLNPPTEHLTFLTTCCPLSRPMEKKRTKIEMEHYIQYMSARWNSGEKSERV